jgi:undecaprenyl-diphosphatase
MVMVSSLTGLFIKLDVLVNAKIALLQAPLLTKIMLVITSLGSIAGLVILSAVAFAFLAYKKRWLNALLLAISMLSGLGAELLIKLIVHRLRPENALVQASGYSFPSGHATMAMLFFSLLIYFFRDEIKNKLWKNAFITASIVLALIVGLSRVYLNVHWLTDVIGGFALGLLWFMLSIFVFKQVKKIKLSSNVSQHSG